MDRMETAMSYVTALEPDQLRAVLAHAAGLHAHKGGIWGTTDALRRIIDRLEEQSSTERMSAIAWRVAHKHGLTLDELRARTSAYEISRPRQEAMYLMRLVCKAGGRPRYSYPRIAKFFGLQDHTTIMHGVRAHKAREIKSRAEREAA